MKKVLKITCRIMLVLIAVLLIFTLVTFIIHRVKTNHELDLLKENGYYNPVSVGDYSLNAAKFGNENGSHTIVALAGLGMGDYSVTERQMTASLEKENLIIFIDRAGYGLSDDTNNEMTLEYIVEDYRKALKNAGIKAPYILMPHSIGGAYANYWSSMYPDEIEAVVFVDGTQLSDNTFADEPERKLNFGDRAEVFLAKLGFSRYTIRDNYYLLPDNYSEEEQRLGDALELMTEDSIAPVSEFAFLTKNGAAAFQSIITNDIPKLYICASWGVQTKEDMIEVLEWFSRLKEKNHIDQSSISIGYDDEKLQNQLDTFEKLRQDTIYPYAEKMGNCKVICLPGDHMIYEQKPEECGRLIKDFIDGLDN